MSDSIPQVIQRILPQVQDRTRRLRRRVLRLWCIWFISVAVLFMYFGYQRRFSELILSFVVVMVSLFLLRRYSSHIVEQLQDVDTLTVEPQTADEYGYRGDVFLEWDETDAAIQDYETAARLNPNIFWAAEVAELLMENQEYRRAKPYIERMLATSDADNHGESQYIAWQAEGWYYKGRIAVEKDVSDVQKAVTCFRKAVHLAPDRAKYCLELVKILLGQNRCDDAGVLLAVTAKVIQNDRKKGWPDLPLFHELVGQFAMQRKEYSVAVTAFRRAIRLESTPERTQLLSSAMAQHQ